MTTLSRRQFVLGTGSTALLAGCGRLPGQPEACEPGKEDKDTYCSLMARGKHV